MLFPMIFLAAWLIDTRLGRNWSTGLGYMIGGFATFILLIAMNFYTLIAVSSAIWGFTTIGYSAMYTLSPESFPSKVRNFGLGLCSMCGRFGMIISSLLLGAILAAGMQEVTICIVALGFILAGVICILVDDTKGTDADAYLAFNK